MIAIIGCGPGSPEYMTPAAMKAAMEADVLVGSRRLLDMVPSASGEKQVNSGNVAMAIEQVNQGIEKGAVAVLVSGDPGVSSLARPLLEKFGASDCRVIPGISSVQVAFAAIGEPWQDARIISAHGEDPVEDGPVAEKYAVLLGRAESMKWVASFVSRLEGQWDAWVCQNLTLENERIEKIDATALGSYEASSLALALLVRKRS